MGELRSVFFIGNWLILYVRMAPYASRLFVYFSKPRGRVLNIRHFKVRAEGQIPVHYFASRDAIKGFFNHAWKTSKNKPKEPPDAF
jgi:hypothetical protein